MGVSKEINDRLLILMKFGELKNLEMLQKGQVYCKNLKWYSDREKETGDKDMGDILEGKYKMTQVTAEFYDYETNELIWKLDNVSSLLYSKNIQRMPVFCITTLTTDDFEFIDKDEFTAFTDIKLVDILSEMFDKPYWNNALIITKPRKFLERVLKACNNSGIEVEGRKVKYTDMNINYIDRVIDLDNDFSNIAFWKDNYFAYQHEYRLAFKGKEVDDSFILNIGDISDISKIYNREELIELMNKEFRLEVRDRKEGIQII